MDVKWIGAALVVFGCGGFGCAIASAHRRQERLLMQLQRMLRSMGWELQFRMTALPELCAQIGKEADGILGRLFMDISRELSWQNAPDASWCVSAVLRRYPDVPPKIRRILRHFGSVLGRFDLQGQLEGIQAVQEEITLLLQDTGKEKEQRLRSYQTLGICAGLALAIILA